MSIDTGVCFNEQTPSAIVPDQHAFKAARKRVAEIVRSLDISPGDYALDDAKKIINLIRDKFVKEIDSYVMKYGFHANIKISIRGIKIYRKKRLVYIIKKTGFFVFISLNLSVISPVFINRFQSEYF